nr:HigA family addiction module antitoxin [Oleomonas cavernae]
MSKSSTTTKLSRPTGRIATHPGEMLLEEFMKPLGLSANALAGLLKVPANRISDLVRGRRQVTADTALRLARYFGTTPELWLNLQTNHDLSKARAEIGHAIVEEIRPRAA